MKTKQAYCLLVLFLLTNTKADIKNLSAISFGPTLHWNIGNQIKKISFGFEVAYWYINDPNLPVSLDLGIEWERECWSMYTELQSGYVFGGVSSGPFIEWNQDKRTTGLQFSLWANLFAGADLRIRTTPTSWYFCPGLYAKLPIGLNDSFYRIE